MDKYESAVLDKWHLNAQRESFDMSDSTMEDSEMFASVSKVEESWIDLEKDEEYEEDHINRSLTSIINQRSDESRIVFMELSDSSAASPPKRQRAGEKDNVNTVVLIGIIATMSFSAGYALGTRSRL